MSERKDIRPGWVMGGGALVLILIAIPLLREFWVPGERVWNALLLLILVAVVTGGCLLQLYFVGHAGEMGEARFDTRNKGEGNG